MSASEYSFIDIAVLDGVRGRFAAGDALAILSTDLEDVIWANGPGARMFGYPDIEAIMGAAAGLGFAQKRQIAATPGYPDIGTDRSLALRLLSGHTSRVVSFLASAIRLPDGERAILLAAPAALAGARDPAEIAARVISGFTEAGYYAALLRSGVIAAAAPGYDALGIAPETVEALVDDVADASDRLVKRRIPAAGRRLPAGIARLSDDPAVHLLIVVDDPEFYRAADFPENTEADRPPFGGAASPEPDRDEPGFDAEHDEPDAAPVDGESRAHIDGWYFEADAPGMATDAIEDAPVAPFSADPDPLARNDVEPGGALEPDVLSDDGTAIADQAAALPFTRSDAPVRFAWRTDAEGRFSAMSREFLLAVDADDNAVIGRSFTDVAAELDIDPDGAIAGLLARRDTWSGKTVLWPLGDTGWRAPVDLAALPVYARDREFEGFRGFGIARPADSIFVPVAVPDPVDAMDTDETEPPTEEPDALEQDMETPAPTEAPAGDDTRAATDPAANATPSADDEDAVLDTADDAETAATTVIAMDEARSRRFSDKIIRLAEHRAPASDRILSPVERNAFREIGDRLKKVTEPRADAPDAPADAGPGKSDLPATSSASPTLADADAVAPVPAAPEDAASLPQEPEAATSEEPPLAEETRGRRATNPFFIEVEEELAEGPVDPEPLPAQPPASAHEASDGDGGIDSQEPASEPTVAAPKDATGHAPDGRMRFEAQPMAEQPHHALGSARAEVRLSADNENGVASASTAPQAPAAEPEPSEAADTTAAGAASDQTPAEDIGAADVAGVGRTVLSRLPLPILVHAGDVLHFANQSFLDFTGYGSLAELDNAGGLGVLFAEPSTESDGEDVPAHSAVLRRQDGQTMPVRAHLQSIPWGRGKALLLALRPADEPLEEIDAQPAGDLAARVEEMRTILDTATDGVVLIATDGTIRSINRPAEALFGYDDGEVAGKPFASLLAVESQRAARDYLQGLSDHGVASVLNDGREVIGRESQGRFIPLFMTIGRLPGGNGFCAVLRDITSWKRAEEELTKARTLAERSSSQKSEFLARVSHEIRTPLNAIIGFSELMMDEKFGPIGNDRYRDYLRDINRSGNHVLDIVNDLLDISKIEAGEQEMAYEAVSLNDVLAEAVAMMQPQANRERVIIRSSFASRLPEVVADLRSVRQIGLNLLSNAVRFTQPGGQVIVSTSYEASGDVVMRVRDTGVGMSSAEIEQALKPFKQINSLKRTRTDGTGLGLPLTKAMVEANRARFLITSAPGEGTLVEICFPSTRVLAD
ncbi:PAS domain S-box protein [Aquibium carbonis]|uniref:histidine kinase n=1 Tax=Aquibium carbonis TaxID=2495581 RepID=A0A429Z0A8_9HYPH|nr:histidine kinase dimerization/phospho-acceptor domain-containing protein [Aquibium carbonis]RST87038.1 PAS domain S-box protein [Aquibium carbonis]